MCDARKACRRPDCGQHPRRLLPSGLHRRRRPRLGADARLHLDNASPAACGATDDTGVTTMYLTVPEDQAVPGIALGRRSPTTGQARGHHLGSTEKASSCTFARGEGVRWQSAPRSGRSCRAPFVNTSVRFLNGLVSL
jgi:hypothetical protein